MLTDRTVISIECCPNLPPNYSFSVFRNSFDSSICTEKGIKVRYSCTQGPCGTCRAQLSLGEVKLCGNYILISDELNKRQILLCQGYPLTDNVIVKPIS